MTETAERCFRLESGIVFPSQVIPADSGISELKPGVDVFLLSSPRKRPERIMDTVGPCHRVYVSGTAKPFVARKAFRAAEFPALGAPIQVTKGDQVLRREHGPTIPFGTWGSVTVKEVIPKCYGLLLHNEARAGMRKRMQAHEREWHRKHMRENTRYVAPSVLLEMQTAEVRKGGKPGDPVMAAEDTSGHWYEGTIVKATKKHYVVDIGLDPKTNERRTLKAPTDNITGPLREIATIEKDMEVGTPLFTFIDKDACITNYFQRSELMEIADTCYLVTNDSDPNPRSPTQFYIPRKDVRAIPELF